MRPAAPKIGKRVFLERITFIWKHLNFSNKAAVRNLFRYKKRLFMTVLGIGGCMGLLLVGFGVKDSIMTIGDRQYNFIHTYQVKMTLADADTDEEKQEVLDSVLKESTTKAAMLSHESTIDACCGANGEKKQSTYLFIPSDADELDEFVSLQNRISGQKYTLDDEGVVISEKLATLLDVSEGDDIYLEVSSLNYKPVKVMHIAENYYYHYVYMTPECYQSLFGKDIEYDEIFVVNKDPEDISYEIEPAIDQLAVNLLDNERFEVKAVISLQTIVQQEVCMEKIVDIHKEPLDAVELMKQPGIVGYIVKKEEQLWDIARHFHTTEAEIMETNGLKSADVQQGDKLLIVKKVSEC